MVEEDKFKFGDESGCFGTCNIKSLGQKIMVRQLNPVLDIVCLIVSPSSLMLHVL